MSSNKKGSAADKVVPEEVSKRGRKQGVHPDSVILYNRHNCLFYKTIKNDKSKVVGRDYTVHHDKVKELQIAFTRAKDTQTTKLLKAVRDKEYKEDVFRMLPNFFDNEKHVDLSSYPPGLFENSDKKIDVVVDKEKALERLDALIVETGSYLVKIGRPDLQTYLETRYSNLKTDDIPIGRKLSIDDLQLAQLLDFKLT